jgi:hypothetical protein
MFVKREREYVCVVQRVRGIMYVCEEREGECEKREREYVCV